VYVGVWFAPSTEEAAAEHYAERDQSPPLRCCKHWEVCLFAWVMV